MFIGYAFKFFDKAAGFSVDVGWVIKDATPVSWLFVIQIGLKVKIWIVPEESLWF